MITGGDLYSVMSAIVPLYVAMIVAYGSVRWWRILSREQCAGINRFVAIFAVPLLSFQIISRNNPYDMSLKFVLADALQKIVVFAIVSVWSKLSSRGSLDWTITLFMLATLPNTLVMGIPLLTAMYGQGPARLVVQAVVLQCIAWYTLLIFLFEYRAARLLLSEKLVAAAAAKPGHQHHPEVVSLSLKQNGQGLTTEASVGDDGKIYVQLKRSPQLASNFPGSTAMTSKASTPGASDLTNAEIYSLHSSGSVLTPAHSDFYLMMSGSRSDSPFRLQELESAFQSSSSNRSSGVHTPAATVREQRQLFPQDEHRQLFPLDVKDEQQHRQLFQVNMGGCRTPNFEENLFRHLVSNQRFSQTALQISKKKEDEDEDEGGGARSSFDYDARELQMFVWSASTSPRTPVAAAQPAAKLMWRKDEKVVVSHETTLEVDPEEEAAAAERTNSCGRKSWLISWIRKLIPSKGGEASAKEKVGATSADPDTPSTAAMVRLILDMVWRKLVRNPNTYSSLLGLTWALVSFRWNVRMPKIVEGSITILSDAGLGMAMFSLGLSMALQPRLIACGTTMTIIGMVLRFVTSPAIMSATSIGAGLRHLELRTSIVQAALPQGIVPFVFAKEYNVHPDVMSTAVIFGMLVSLPITLLYYVLLGL